MELSLVVPAYNERENLAPLLDEITSALAGRTYEVIVVDDGSTDGTLQELKALRAKHPQLRVLALERNSGQTAAFAAGFHAARAPIVISLDADLQNDPTDIARLVDRQTAYVLLLPDFGDERVVTEDEWRPSHLLAFVNESREWLVDIGKTAELAADAELPDLLGAIRR